MHQQAICSKGTGQKASMQHFFMMKRDLGGLEVEYTAVVLSNIWLCQAELTTSMHYEGNTSQPELDRELFKPQHVASKGCHDAVHEDWYSEI